jgi:hypothetical protein
VGKYATFLAYVHHAEVEALLYGRKLSGNALFEGFLQLAQLIIPQDHEVLIADPLAHGIGDQGDGWVGVAGHGRNNAHEPIHHHVKFYAQVAEVAHRDRFDRCAFSLSSEAFCEFSTKRSWSKASGLRGFCDLSSVPRWWTAASRPAGAPFALHRAGFPPHLKTKKPRLVPRLL